MNYIEVLDSIDAAVWGPPMIILLLGCHIYTIRTKGIPAKTCPWPSNCPSRKITAPRATSATFGAMATSLASTLGTGSIVGVATAVLSGGPGAVLWMWLTGILGMATKYTEVYAAMKYRVKDRQGHMMGGAMRVGAALQAPRRHRAVVGEVHGHLVRRHGVPHHRGRIGRADQRHHLGCAG